VLLGSELNMEYVERTGLKAPVVIREDSKGTGLKIPDGLCIKDVVDLVGEFGMRA
jgi:hypothetical protein